MHKKKANDGGYIVAIPIDNIRPIAISVGLILDITSTKLAQVRLNY
jgi:hypothetical protein